MQEKGGNTRTYMRYEEERREKMIEIGRRRKESRKKRMDDGNGRIKRKDREEKRGEENKNAVLRGKERERTGGEGGKEGGWGRERNGRKRKLE